MQNSDNKFNLSIEAINIGPHENVIWSSLVGTNKTGIFASNGKGKSFLGRAFQYIADESRCKNIVASNRMITIGKNDGAFKFEIDGKKSVLTFKRDSEVLRKNEYYIFHVFNSNYVEENIIKRNYGLPNEDDLNGYILGKSNVDLDKDKRELEVKRQTIKSKLEEFQKKSLTKLLDYAGEFNISRNSEYKELLQQIKNLDSVPETIFKDVSANFDTVRENYKKLAEFPADEEDVPCYNKLQTYIDENAVKENLIKVVKKVEIADSCLEDFMKSNKDFIEKGIELFNSQSDKCPFCKRNTDGSIISIIKKYNEFLKSPEKEMISFCEQQIVHAEKEIRSLSDIKKNLDVTKFKYAFMKDKLVNYRHELSISGDVFTSLEKEIKEIIKKLNEKKADVSLELDLDLSQYSQARQEFITDMTRIEALVIGINEEKNKIASQQKLLRTSIIPLIRSQILDSQELEDLWKEQSEADKLEEKIKEKEDKENIPAKKRYMETLKTLLNFFFRDKYKVSDAGVISFKDNDVSSNFDHVLSEGEKTIVSFCYYLAEVHLIVKDESDYNKVFFIIDDPISSLDANYVYNICEIIRGLLAYFPGIKHEKYLILTHSIEFMGILTRNGIINNDLELINGTLARVDKDRFRIPYLAHLRDIQDVVSNNKPTHTTANSIRNILESINNFLCPGRSLEDFINTEEALKGTSIYTTSQDGSHGNLNNWSVLADAELVALSKDLLNYIQASLFKGQLNALQPSARKSVDKLTV
ncbi:AAA family ATPase [bacterium]|nr:AAA family ATPase [bacterium]